MLRMLTHNRTTLVGVFSSAWRNMMPSLAKICSAGCVAHVINDSGLVAPLLDIFLRAVHPIIRTDEVALT